MPQTNVSLIRFNEQSNENLFKGQLDDLWKHKTVDLVDAILCILTCKTVSGELDVSISVSLIHQYLALQNLVQLYIEGREGKIPELAFLPIKAYFETGLPGFNPSWGCKLEPPKFPSPHF